MDLNDQFERINKAYANDLLPVIVPVELKHHFEDAELCEWVREFAKHWYTLGREDEAKGKGE